jgi:hypothetical protein
MNPRQYKATISENKAINKFLEQGYYVFKNCCEQGPIDIIVVNPQNGRAAKGVEERKIFFWPGAVARELVINYKDVEPLFTVDQPWTHVLEPALKRVLVHVP